jgi:glycosyltransferase involved in cell wall biosynthesis
VAVRVTHLVDSPTFGGAERTIGQLLAGLPAPFVSQVAASTPVPTPLAQAAGERLVTFGGTHRSWRILPAARHATLRTRPDLVHVMCIDPRSNRALLAAALGSGAPVVASVHMTGECGARTGGRVLAGLYRRVDAVLAVSAQIRTLLVDRLGVPPPRVQVIANGVETIPVRPLPWRPGLPVRIGGLGRLTPQKGWDVLVEAARNLVGEGHDVEVMVAGDGRDRDRLARLAAGLPVRFPGSTDDVAGFLLGVDVFCLPSRAEGLPLALLEAMMAGRPAVTTTVGGIPAAVGRGSAAQAALLVPPGSVAALTAGLRRLVLDPPLRARLGAAGAARARTHFRVERTVAEVAEVYARVLDKPGPRGPHSRVHLQHLAGENLPVVGPGPHPTRS